MEEITIKGFVSFTIAIILLFVGKHATQRFATLRKYSIPEPVIGGFLCASVVAVLYYIFDKQVTFNLEVRDILLLYFFAGIGLNADFKTLISGGKPLLILTLMAVVYIVLQNFVGIGVATAFGMEPLMGMMSGSISLIGGVGTTVAWAPIFDEMGISGASEIGIASNTIGLLAACLIGGPVANYLIKRDNLATGSHEALDIGIQHNTEAKLDYFGVLHAWLILNVCIIFGYGLDMIIAETGLKLPMFVSCLIVGIIIGNLKIYVLKREFNENSQQGLGMISDISLGMFLTMALMGLQLWQLQSAMVFLASVMTLQALLSVIFTVFIVYRFMGRDYEAAVISSGFGGITLGSTATAIVNMTAVTQQNGAAHRAFIIVPLVCGFFIDLANAMIINYFVGAIG
ncbi:Sodium/glutamate symporter [Sinobacterium norvegicum]|uniref:Sodium/glutamate symporter n=1 Tax=Sinobacterium norvegicum TaxID=1641715 RepID=A0ABM9ADU8_9GAMM|nr:sodium/glutamate symporter [Sinobacterium norvegicum]CAH0991104.1 Sodium/glutamate symporter [Sinobacterium norvegicum]